MAKRPKPVRVSLRASRDAATVGGEDHMSFLLRIYDPAYPPDPPASTPMPFVWDAVDGATSYVLKVGTASGQSDRYDGDVGNTLTYTLALTTGVYWGRSVVVGGAHDGELTAGGEQPVTV